MPRKLVEKGFHQRRSCPLSFQSPLSADIKASTENRSVPTRPGADRSHLSMPSPPTAPVALDKAYALALWLIGKIGAMPRAHRFTLGDRIYCQSLDLVTALTQATFSSDKSLPLETASDRVNSLRILLRLAKDIKLLPFDPYTYATGILDEIGRMIG